MTMDLAELVSQARDLSIRLGCPVTFECNGAPIYVTPICDLREALAKHQVFLEKSRSRRERAEKPPALTVLLKTREGMTAPIRVQCPGVRLNTDSLVEADLAALPIATRAAMIDDLTAPTDWESAKHTICSIKERSDENDRGFDVTGRRENGIPVYLRFTIMEVRHLVRDVFDNLAAEEFRKYVPRLPGHFVEVTTREKICIGSWAIITETRYRGVRGTAVGPIGPCDMMVYGGESGGQSS